MKLSRFAPDQVLNSRRKVKWSLHCDHEHQNIFHEERAFRSNSSLIVAHPSQYLHHRYLVKHDREHRTLRLSGSPTHEARALSDLHAPWASPLHVPINDGRLIQTQFPSISGKSETSASNLRRFSISFSQEIIRFQLGNALGRQLDKTIEVYFRITARHVCSAARSTIDQVPLTTVVLTHVRWRAFQSPKWPRYQSAVRCSALMK